MPIVVAHGKLNVKQKWTETPPSENGGKKARKVVLTQGSPRSWGGAIPFVVSRRSACVDFKPRLSKKKKYRGAILALVLAEEASAGLAGRYLLVFFAE